ncbi:MAG: ABC transporter permease [Planctomycetota bacterium]|nr:ABC transporter permease [Planctomycetota bacterium]
MMEKILVIARREFRAAVVSKAFLISIILMPVMMLGSLGVQIALERFRPDEERLLGVIDRTPGKGLGVVETLNLLSEVNSPNKMDPFGEQGGEQGDKKQKVRIKFVAIEPTGSDDLSILKQRVLVGDKVRNRELSGFFDIHAEALSTPPKDAPPREDVTYYTDRAFDRDVLTMASGKVLSAVYLQRAARMNPLLLIKGRNSYTPEELSTLIRETSKAGSRGLSMKDLPHFDPATGQPLDGQETKIAENLIVPLVLVLLMFMVIMMGASPLLQAVIEEKMQRIAEVLLGSAQPFDILMGKLLGMTTVGVLLALVYLLGGAFIASRFDAGRFLRADLVIWFIVFETMALLMFGAVFLAVGSAVSDIKQAQTLLTPVTLIITIPLFVLMRVIEDPGSGLARWMSLFPTATPMMMLARIALQPDLPLWEPLLGVFLMLITTLVVVLLASRIFRIGYLSQGQAPKLRDLIGWMIKGE